MKTNNSKKSGKTQRQIDAPATPPKLQKVLATTDFSDESLAGVRYAVALAEKLGAALALLHVIEPPSRLGGMESVVLAREDSEVAALARAQLTTLAKRESAGDSPVTSSLRAGKPFHEITTAAREGAADLIVIATHGHTGVKRALLGSTAERVVRHASLAQCSPSPPPPHPSARVKRRPSN